MRPAQIIISNRARCKLCEDVIESVHRHDFRYCRCGEIFVDGGKEYLRRGANNFANFEELSETKDTNK
mgnify:CR=1 FL=1